MILCLTLKYSSSFSIILLYFFLLSSEIRVVVRTSFLFHFCHSSVLVKQNSAGGCKGTVAIEESLSCHHVLSMIKIIQTDTVARGFYQQFNNSYYSTLYIATILRVYVIYNICNHTLLLYSLSQ